MTQQNVWSPEQARRFLDHVADDPLEPIWTLALATGLRRAELVGLRWTAVDLTAGSLEVRTTITTVWGKDVTTTGKTDAAQRRLMLDEHLVATLNAHRTQTRPVHRDSDGPVFTDADGAAIRPQRLTTTLRRLATDAGLPPIGVHGLRHTAATLMRVTGVPVHLVANRLGHADASATPSVYAHVMPNDDRIAAQTIASVLFPAPKKPTTSRPVPGRPENSGSSLGHRPQYRLQDHPVPRRHPSPERPGQIGF